MSPPDLLYRAPGASPPPDHATLSAAELTHVVKVFLTSLVGGSLFAGTVECLRAGHALHPFSAEHWAAGMVALGALRITGAGVAFSAAGMALVAAVHRRSTAGTAPPEKGMLQAALFALPVAAVGAACSMIAAAVGTASLAFDVPASASWDRIRAVVSPVDPLVGAAVASLFALVLAGTAPRAGRFLAELRGRLIVKIVLVLVVTQTMTAMLDAAMTAASPSNDDPVFPGAAGQLHLQICGSLALPRRASKHTTLPFCRRA